VTNLLRASSEDLESLITAAWYRRLCQTE